MTGAQTAFLARGLSFTYRGATEAALTGVDLELSSRAWALLLGPSGAGKSTLTRAVNGTIPRFFPGTLAGDMEVAGRPTAGVPVPVLAASAGVVFQDFETQILSTSCLLDVAFALESRCLPPDEIRRRALELLSRVGLGGFADRDPVTLSGGEKQRLVIASVLALEPPLLVLDEPASDLDPAGRASVYQLVESLREGAVLLVEHDLEGLPPAEGGFLLESGRVTARWSDEAEIRRDADRLEGAGVRPSPMASLAAALGLRWGGRLGTGIPLEPRALSRRLLDHGWTFDAAVTPPRRARARSGREVLRCDRVSHAFHPGGESVAALREVSFSLSEGERLLIVGANGSGKTTLARHLVGLLKPDAGEVLLGGRPVSGQAPPERARRIGIVFQNPDHQIFAGTVMEEVAFGPAQLGLPSALARARCDAALAAVGLSGKEDADPFTLTKGERQRLALASVLVCEPAVIVLDEPTTGLDLRQQRDVMALMDRLQDHGHALVIITHALWLADHRTDHVLVLSEGRVAAEGPPEEILLSEEILAGAGLRVPDLAILSRCWNAPLLPVEVWAAALTPPDAPR